MSISCLFSCSSFEFYEYILPSQKYRGRGKNDSPISSLNGIAPPRMVYDNYSGYRKTFYDMILLQVSIRIQEGFNFEDTDKVA